MIESAFKLTTESINYRGSCYRHKDWVLYCWKRGYSDSQVLAAHLRPGRESHRRLPTRKQSEVESVLLQSVKDALEGSMVSAIAG